MSAQPSLFDVSEVNALTQKLTFPARFEECLQRWAANEAAHRAEWTEENLCIAWVTESDGRHHREWWAGLPEYQRNFYFNLYRDERRRADYWNRGRMASLKTLLGELDEQCAWEEKAAQRWADEIREAAIRGQPCPFILHDDATGFESMAFNSRLRRAFQIAGVVIVPAAAPVEEKKGRRRTAEAAA